MALTYVHHLWGINYEVELLDDVKADLFRYLIAKLPYITKSTIPDIEPDVALFTTHIEKSNVDDWKKLRIFIS